MLSNSLIIVPAVVWEHQTAKVGDKVLFIEMLNSATKSRIYKSNWERLKLVTGQDKQWIFDSLQSLENMSWIKVLEEKTDEGNESFEVKILFKLGFETPQKAGVKVPKPKKQTDPRIAQLIDVYYNWYKQTEGFEPKISDMDARAAKEILAHFHKISATYDALDLFKIMLDNWSILEPFYQQKKRLIDINNNFNLIVSQLKNGRKSKNRSHNELDSYAANLTGTAGQ